jgi:exopolyphosphatase/guanosine-5'-triphosphate,3'-diphosphate pyrophosphatase
MSSKVAIIDVGTNTINLLIVDKTSSNFEVLHKARNGIGLGHRSFKETKITPPAFERGLKCLIAYADICKSFKTHKVLAFGTSALRHAQNASHFISEVRKHSNIDIKVINGDAEAELIYNGIKLLYDFEETSLVMDIGGGSTEFILADINGIINKSSFEIGVSRINQMFNFSDPYNKWDIYKINNYLNDFIGNRLSTYKTKTLVGSSGSFKTFYSLWSLNKAPLKTFTEIKFSDFMSVLDEVIHSSLTERKSNPLIDNLRVEMLPISAVKTKWVIDQIGIEKILISPYSLKEGVIFSN